LWSTGETTASITVSPYEDTNYWVTVSNEFNSDTDDVNVFVNSIPDVDAGEDANINEGDSVTLTATGNGSFEWSTGETTQSITVSPEETTTYTVFISSNGCDNFDEVTVYVHEAVEAYAGEDQTICQSTGGTVLTATGGDYYLWNTGATTASIEVDPLSTSTYTVIVSNDFSSDTDEVTVYVSPNPDVHVSEDVSIIEGEFVTLSASGANTYEWSNGATQPNIAVSPSVTTSYSVTGYINGCSDTEEVVVTVLEAVDAYAGDDVDICLGQSVVLTATGGDSYQWNTGETTPSITVNPNEDTLYTVLVSNAIDSQAADVMVFVNNCDGEEEEEEIELGEVNEFEFFAVYRPSSNPNTVRVQLVGLEGTSQLLFHNVHGQMVHQETLQDNNGQPFEVSVNISGFNLGVYFITLVELDKQTSKQVLFH